MKPSKEVTICKQLFYRLGRYEKLRVIKNSNLDDRERKAMTLRFIEGATVQHTAYLLNMTDDAYSKMQKRTFKKLYVWLNRYAKQNGTTIDNLFGVENSTGVGNHLITKE